MKSEWRQTLNEMRDAGYAVIVWTPDELKDVEAEWVEECSISYGWKYLIPSDTDNQGESK